MNKKKLSKQAEISTYTINRLNIVDDFITDIIFQMCKILKRTMDDIIKFTED